MFKVNVKINFVKNGEVLSTENEVKEFNNMSEFLTIANKKYEYVKAENYKDSKWLYTSPLSMGIECIREFSFVN